MTPDAFFSPLNGQSLLLPGQSEDFRGQCVQSVGLWVQTLGLKFPAYPFAYLYYQNGIPGYNKIARGAAIKEGDIVIWGPDFPSSPEAGHIDVASSDGTIDSFWAWDSNWSPPLKLNKIHHTGTSNTYIIGYLRKQGDTMDVEDLKNHIMAVEAQVDQLTKLLVSYDIVGRFEDLKANLIGRTDTITKDIAAIPGNTADGTYEFKKVN